MAGPLNLLSARAPSRPDGLPMLLVAVNLLLLSFFVLLNAMATKPTSKAERHADDVLARVREGYDQKPKNPGPTDTALPREPITSWAEAMTRQVQGVLTNRLQLQTEVLQADASRVVIRLPLAALFAQERLIGAELLRSLGLASRGAKLRWRLSGAAPQVVAQGAALAAVVGAIEVTPGLPDLQLILTPQPETPPTVGGGLEQLQGLGGMAIQGEAQQ